MTQATWPINQ